MRVSAMGSNLALTNLAKIGIVTFFLLAIGVIFKNRKNKETAIQTRIRKLILLFFAFNIFSTIVGLGNGFYNKVIPDIFNSISGLTVVYAVAGLSINEKKLVSFLKTFSIVFTSVFIISLILMGVSLQMGLNTYLALFPSGLVISYFYFGNHTDLKFKGKLLVLLLFLLSLKRSIILSFISTLLFFFSVKKFKNFISILAATTIGMLLFVSLVFGLGKLGERVDLPIVKNTINKINQVNPLSEKYNFKIDSGGDRVAEVMSVFKAFEENNYSWWIGAGNGFTYRRNYGYFDDLYLLHNVHFTPIAIISRYGIFISVFIFLIIFKYLFWIISIYQTSPLSVQTLLFYQIFGFTATLFSYSIATDFILWITMGLIFAYRSKQEMVRAEIT